MAQPDGTAQALLAPWRQLLTERADEVIATLARVEGVVGLIL